MCFCLLSRQDKRDCHLALPYYKMSGLSVTDVIQRNMAMCRGPVPNYGKGFLFFLKHSLYEETMEELTEVRKLLKHPVVTVLYCYYIQYILFYYLILKNKYTYYTLGTYTAESKNLSPLDCTTCEIISDILQCLRNICMTLKDN